MSLSSNKIIRDQNSLLSQLSNISNPIEYRKNQGFSLFCPSIPIKGIHKAQKSEFVQRQVQPDRLGQGFSLLCDLQLDFGNQPNLNNQKKKWINIHDHQAQGVSENQQQPDHNLTKPVSIITPQIPKAIKHILIKKISKKSHVKIQASYKNVELKAPKKRKKVKKGQNKTKGYMKNQTKNIPKNFGKAIISFIQKNQTTLRVYAESIGKNWEEFIYKLVQQKKRINTIADLRKMWTQFDDAKLIRVFSNIFLRKYGYQYVFHSRVSNVTVHLKYRRRLADAIKNPQDFVHIKQY